ncbi:MAG: MMPL family transporter [Gemmatimonadales bacterium]
MERVTQGLVRWRWLVIAVWAIAGFFALRAAPDTANRLNLRGGSRRPTEAAHADSLIRSSFPKPLSEFFAVTIEGPDSVDRGRSKAFADALEAASQRLPYVRGTISFASSGDPVFVSRDRRTTFFIVALNTPTSDSAGALVVAFRRVIRETAATFPEAPAYKVRVTGRAPLDVDVRSISAQDSADAERRLLPLTLIILVLAFGALVSATLPLVVGILTIAVALALIGVVARYTPMSVFVLNLTTMIGLGVGIDYSLLVVTRFREELSKGLSRTAAAVTTLRTAGAAVVTSGLTVVVGFAALLLTPVIETQSVGIGGLIVVGAAVLLSTTLLPALLAVLGRNIDRPRWLSRRLAWYHSPLLWEKWARSLGRHPKRALGFGGLIIAVLTLPAFWMRIGLPAKGWWPAATEAGQGVVTLERMGAAGVIQPIRLVIHLPEGRTAVSATSLRGIRLLADSLRADPRVADVKSLVDVVPGQSLLAYSLLYSDLPQARAQYGAFLDAYLSIDARTTLIDIIPSDTTSLLSGMGLVHRTRALAAVPPKQLRGAEFAVGGFLAASVDFQANLLKSFPLIIIAILSVTALMLAIAFKSLLVPLKAVIMNSLSVSATFGVIVLVFQEGWGAQYINLDGASEAIFVVVPVLVFAIVFGLSMDYEVFLLARIKEAFDRTGKNDTATMEGLSATASTITSAALIMIVVFGAFAFSRVLMVQFIGFGLAVAVFLDATVIRMVLVPAFMHMMGRWNWWPGVRLRKDPKDRT